MYHQDSILTLTGPEAAGLVALGLILAVASALLLRRLARNRGTASRLALAVFVFWGFLWLSPQVYYGYYRLIIPGLPDQVVIGAPPGPTALLRLATFTDRATVSEHAKGGLFWLLLLAALWRRGGRRQMRN